MSIVRRAHMSLKNLSLDKFSFSYHEFSFDRVSLSVTVANANKRNTLVPMVLSRRWIGIPLR